MYTYSGWYLMIVHQLVSFCYRYMRTAKKGDTIAIAAECLKIGKTMAFVSVDILSKTDGNKLIAQGRQAAKLQ